MTTQKKIAVIGATGFSMQNEEVWIQCFPWDKLQKLENLKDYNTVIISLLKFQNGEMSLDKANWQHFYKVFHIESAMDSLFNQSNFYIVGDPRFILPLSHIDNIPFLYWTSINFFWDGSPGTQIHHADGYKDIFKLYEPYGKHLKKWNYALKRVELNTSTLKVHPDSFRRMKIFVPHQRRKSVYWNLVKEDLIFEVCIAMYHKDGGDPLFEYGNIIFLPDIGLTEDETLLIVVRDLCKVDVELPSPDWASSFQIPGEKELAQEVEVTNTELLNTLERLKQKQQDLAEHRKPVRLLYDRGKSFERMVRATLAELGATVEEPVDETKEDGWVTVEINGKVYEGVLEIKSTKNDMFGEDGIKQLLDWQGRGVQLRGKPYKGIFIGSSAILKAPNERLLPYSSSFQMTAQMHHHIAITGEQLFKLYAQHLEGKLDTDALWEAIFSTEGIFDATPLLAPQSDFIEPQEELVTTI